MLAPLLEALEFRCNNVAYRPVMDTIDLLGRYADAPAEQRARQAVPEACGVVALRRHCPDQVLGVDCMFCRA